MRFIKFKKIVAVVFMMCTTLITNAQDTAKQSAGFMRSNGRIYVVIAVMITILTGLILYVIRLDKKISKLEKE